MVVDTIDLSEHELENAIKFLHDKPWKSIVINQRVLTIDSESFSLHSGLHWKLKEQGNLSFASEIAVPNALGSL